MHPSTTANPRTPLDEAFSGRRVLVTGHSGFMGSWLCEWLLTLGAQITGFSLPPETEPSMFEQLHITERIDNVFGDVRNPDGLKRLILEQQPSYVFHLAGQCSTRRAHREPVCTWQTNVLGTLHLLEALKALRTPCAAIVLGSDRAYEIKPSVYGYREDDPLGGIDPCSSSQAAAEVAVEAWRQAFFKNHPVRLATVRAGHTIGGGDWAETRLIPQCARAWLSGRPIRIREPEATRFWQHVMEPLSGCLWLAARLAQSSAPVNGLANAFNFGPGPDARRTVREVLMEARKLIGAEWVERTQRPEVRDDAPIRLSVGKAAALLGWRTVWTFSDAVRETIRWYFDVAHASDPELAIRLTRDQIDAYVGRARDLGLPWACFAEEQQATAAEPQGPEDQPAPTDLA